MTADQVTVLAVDDQPANLRLLDAVLTPRGYRVITASSGAEALALLEAGGIDIVLLDIVMPELDGHAVCRMIRARPATEFLPVVMITASGSDQRLAALESGADDFLTKPFDKSELLARVASLARIKRYHDTIKRQAAELAQHVAHRAQRALQDDDVAGIEADVAQAFRQPFAAAAHRDHVDVEALVQRQPRRGLPG